MMFRIKQIVPLLLLLLCGNTQSDAQLFQNRLRWKPGEPKIKAVLVRIWTYKGRVQTLQGTPDAEFLAAELQKAVDTVRPLTIRDWTENFNYCPVYYFVDTNIDRIINHDFAGILLDKNMKPVENPVISESDTAYFIASSDPWLKVYDHKLRVLPDNMPNGQRFDGMHFRRTKKYFYRTESFRFGNRAIALDYNAAMRRYYRNYPGSGSGK